MQKKRIINLLFMLITFSLLLIGCSTSLNSNVENNKKLTVVASFYPIYDFANQVAGDRADVSMLLSSGEDAHLYEPSAKDVVIVEQADVFVYSSDEMEFWANSLLNAIDNQQLIVAKTVDFDELNKAAAEKHKDIDDSHLREADSDQSKKNGTHVIIEGLQGHYHTGDTVTLKATVKNSKETGSWHWYKRAHPEIDWELLPEQHSDLLEYRTDGESMHIKAVLHNNQDELIAESEPIAVSIDDHEGIDPHVWLDPMNAQQQVLAIRDAFIKADPDGKEVYTQNANAYNQKLQTLHEQYQQAFLTAENRIFVVQHQAFGHLADRYQLQQLSIGGLSTEVEPSPSRISEINTIVDEFNIPTIYYQNGANSAIAQTVATETNTAVAVLYDFETIPELLDNKDVSYLNLMLHNLEALKKSIN